MPDIPDHDFPPPFFGSGTIEDVGPAPEVPPTLPRDDRKRAASADMPEGVGFAASPKPAAGAAPPDPTPITPEAVKAAVKPTMTDDQIVVGIIGRFGDVEAENARLRSQVESALADMRACAGLLAVFERALGDTYDCRLCGSTGAEAHREDCELLVALESVKRRIAALSDEGKPNE